MIALARLCVVGVHGVWIGRGGEYAVNVDNSLTLDGRYIAS